MVLRYDHTGTRNTPTGALLNLLSRLHNIMLEKGESFVKNLHPTTEEHVTAYYSTVPDASKSHHSVVIVGPSMLVIEYQ